MPDLFGRSMWPFDKGTVAVAEIDGRLHFGVNSKAPGYEDRDWDFMRDNLVAAYPDLARRNPGEIPNDSLFHAESTILLRAAREQGGTLADRTIEVHVDRIPCMSCELVLPRLGVELGNPRVTYVEKDTGLRSTMQDGRWLMWRSR
jgi:hypothetical protein